MKKLIVGLLAVVLMVFAGCGEPQPTASPLAAEESVGKTPTPYLAPAGDSGEDIAPVPDSVELSGEGIAAIVAVLTSLAFVYVPGLASQWSEFDYKREALGAAGLVVSVGLVGLHYVGAIDLGLPGFGWSVIWRTLRAWLAFAGSAQLSYTVQKA
jgi:hypothetical protein